MKEWTEGRVLEFEELQTLIRTITMINYSSNFMEKIKQCIEIAIKLQKGDITILRESFMDFLKAKIIEERENKINT
ncbi:MAG: hypothetical protein WC623_24245 [Pedobacter sp.]|uniref:hypothetical protein n=1 Tax=Pedobacter sp. TaxID=1411316 RepID=UPI00356199FA